jgi:hypothetical protein
MQAIALHGRIDSDTIPWSETRVIALDHETEAILLDVPNLWLVVDGPRRVELVLVDGDGRLAGGNNGLGLAEEPALALGTDARDELVGDLRAAVEFNAGRNGFGDSDGEREVLLWG